MTDDEFYAICDHLRANLDLTYVHSDGRWLMRAMPDGVNFLAIKAKDGEDFSTMSEEVLNHYVTQTLP